MLADSMELIYIEEDKHFREFGGDGTVYIRKFKNNLYHFNNVIGHNYHKVPKYSATKQPPVGGMFYYCDSYGKVDLSEIPSPYSL